MNKKEVVKILKEGGLDIAEDAAVSAVKSAIALLRVLLPKLSNGFGLAFNLLMDAYEIRIYDLLDEIDGKNDPKLGSN